MGTFKQLNVEISEELYWKVKFRTVREGVNIKQFITKILEKELCLHAEKEYKYGMRLRGFSIGCQPMDGFIRREDCEKGKYHDILVYNRMLGREELKNYELDYLGEHDK